MRFLWRSLKALQCEDRGQDLAAYCLLTALVALVALGILIHVSGGMKAVWYGANTSLTAGNAAVNASATPADTPTSAPGH
jgi:Flp pilus assembly pilin Flp